MNPVDQSRRRTIQLIGGRGCLLVPFVVLSALAGCENSLGSRQRDPMLGIPPPSPIAATGNTSNTGGTPPATGTADRTPPLPATYTAPGPAAVASGQTATSDNPRELRVPGDASAPPAIPTGGAARGVAPVSIGSPEPATNGSPSNLVPVPATGGALQQTGATTPAAPPAGSAAANIRSFEEAQQYLKQHGVNWQRLIVDEGEWKFECGVPNPKTPTVNHHYQTSRAFPDPLPAILEVIAQIEKEPR